MSTKREPSANAGQIEKWNAGSGETWTLFQEELDRQIAPLGLEALRILAPRRGEAIIDIGCGCGQTSLDLAQRVGHEGRVLGIDVSAPMLEVARRREAASEAARPEFRQIDAQNGDLERHAFDAAYSRFGVMFFSDPTAAFANIREALKPRGRLCFVCWRSLEENPWMREPYDAGLQFLSAPTPADSLAPGPFAFADARRTQSILQNAGFDAVHIQPFDTPIGGSDLDTTLRLTLAVGPLGSTLREIPELKETVSDAVCEVLKRFLTPAGVFMQAAVWLVVATRCGAKTR